MASAEHCLYCFDVLATALEDKDPVSLEHIQETWPSYLRSLEDDIDKASAEPDYDMKVPGNAPPVKDETERSEAAPDKASGLRIPALQRLGRSSNSSSSSSSTPSSASSTSLAPSTTATTPEPVSHSGLNPPRTPITASPLFVTWNTVTTTSAHRSLRGCIGTFESQKLSSGLEQYALISALQDTRFSPITASELPSLEVSVTLLTDFEEADDEMDWEIGVHGLKISFTAKNRRYGSCYLPDVAAEQGWTKEETVYSLMRKAGWSGRKEKMRDVADFKVTRFQGKAESLRWGEYSNWKQWVESIDDK